VAYAINSSAGGTGQGLTCFACGGPIEAALEQVGSLRCLDCRDMNRPLADPTRSGRFFERSLAFRLRRQRR
jgi:hypothetical protein